MDLNGKLMIIQYVMKIMRRSDNLSTMNIKYIQPSKGYISTKELMVNGYKNNGLVVFLKEY